MKNKVSAILLVVLALSPGCATESPDPATVTRVDPLTGQPVNPAATASAPPTSPPNSAAHDESPGVQMTGEVSLQRNFYFVFDGSGSMHEAPPSSGGSGEQRFRSKIEAAKWAVRQFMTTVPNDVNLGLYVFDSRGQREVIPLGPNNRVAFLNAIENVRANQGTPLGDAIAKGVDALVEQYKKQLGYGEYRLIVVTDGEASDDLNAGVTQALRYSIPIYTVGFGIGEGHALRKYSVSYKNALSAGDLQQALTEAGSELDVYDPGTFKQKQ
jgi:uncharacterized protein YegL